MRSIIRFILLAFPLLWFAAHWCKFAFGLNIESGLSENHSVMFDNLWFLWTFIGTPVSLIIGLIYTATKNYWIWFAAYMVLGGIPVFGFALAAMP